MSACTCPCPPPSLPCRVHFIAPGEADWIDIKETEAYHPTAVLRPEFNGKLCRRCGAKLAVPSKLCPSCDTAVAKQRTNVESWMKSSAAGSDLKIPLPGRTF